MNASTRNHSDPEPAEVYARFMARMEGGETTDFAELCRQHPQLADGLRDLHGLQETVDELRRSSVVTPKPAT